MFLETRSAPQVIERVAGMGDLQTRALSRSSPETGRRSNVVGSTEVMLLPRIISLGAGAGKPAVAKLGCGLSIGKGNSVIFALAQVRANTVVGYGTS